MMTQVGILEYEAFGKATAKFLGLDNICQNLVFGKPWRNF